MVMVFRGFRFDPELYGEFRRLAVVGGVTVTGVFERFMGVCVEVGGLVFPECGVGWSLRRVFWLIGWGRGSVFIVGRAGWR